MIYMNLSKMQIHEDRKCIYCCENLGGGVHEQRIAINYWKLFSKMKM